MYILRGRRIQLTPTCRNNRAKLKLSAATPPLSPPLCRTLSSTALGECSWSRAKRGRRPGGGSPWAGAPAQQGQNAVARGWLVVTCAHRNNEREGRGESKRGGGDGGDGGGAHKADADKPESKHAQNTNKDGEKDKKQPLNEFVRRSVPASTKAEAALVQLARARQEWVVVKTQARSCGLPESAIPEPEEETAKALRQAIMDLLNIIASFQSSGL
mmetsp:Transcript_1331/g.3217  ORF Transcript_1331/g.3217 Transcript_1331/m.3217 type:complete len:215 (-) Transcript_1331:65-709(-)